MSTTRGPMSSGDVIIDLDQAESGRLPSAEQLVHRLQYLQLRENVAKHLDRLGNHFGHDERFPTGSGWTQFLDGTRGAGKSTFLNATKAALQNDHDIKSRLAFIDVFDPTRIETSELILLVILQQLRKQVDAVLQGRRQIEDDHVRDEWRRAFRGVAGGLSLFAREYHPLDDLDPDLFLDWGLERAGNGIDLRNKLHRLFATACRILSVRALMLAFDDADTDATHAVSLLECIRKYLDAPIVMVVVTGDLELYSLLVQQHFAKTVVGRSDAALDLQRHSAYEGRSTQYLRMIDHLEEQYLLKLFPIRQRMQLQSLKSVMANAHCLIAKGAWKSGPLPVQGVADGIVRYGLRVKGGSDVALYTDFLLKQPLRSVLQVLASCAPALVSIIDAADAEKDPNELTRELARTLQALALTSLYKFSVDTDAIAAQDLPALTQAIFDLALRDGDLDTAPYLRPLSASADVRACFAALSAEVPKLCAGKPAAALRYLLRGPGSVSLFSIARDQQGPMPAERLHEFRLYMGIGRAEDSLDWARRATAVIALPHALAPKSRAVLAGAVGLLRKKHKGTSEHSFRSAITLSVSSSAISYLPVFALSIVDVAGGTATRSYASILVLLGLLEKLLSKASAPADARTIFFRSYPPLTVSAPAWWPRGSAEEVPNEDAGKLNKRGSEMEKLEALWSTVEAWRQQSLEISNQIFPSAIFLGKVWTRLFFSLQKACDDLRPKATLADVMEIYALCAINAFLVEEVEHHFPANGGNHTDDLRIHRNNPRASAKAYVEKLKSMQLKRAALPLTSIIATCPLLLGLLDRQLPYAEQLQSLFPIGTTTDKISELLRPKEVGELMRKISIAGKYKADNEGGDSELEDDGE